MEIGAVIRYPRDCPETVAMRRPIDTILRTLFNMRTGAYVHRPLATGCVATLAKKSYDDTSSLGKTYDNTSTLRQGALHNLMMT